MCESATWFFITNYNFYLELSLYLVTESFTLLIKGTFTQVKIVLVNSTDMHTWSIPPCPFEAYVAAYWQQGRHLFLSLSPNWHLPVQPPSQLSLLIPLSRSPQVYLFSSTCVLPLPLLYLPSLSCSLIPSLSHHTSRILTHSAAGMLMKVSPRPVLPDFPLGHLEFTAGRQRKQTPTQNAGLQATPSFPTLRVARFSDPQVQGSLYRDPHWQWTHLGALKFSFYLLNSIVPSILIWPGFCPLKIKVFCFSLHYCHTLSSYDSRSHAVCACVCVCL